MPHSSSGLHVHTVSLDGAHHVCAIWKTRRDRAAGHDCAFSGAWLLPRQGPEQDWAVEIALDGLRAGGLRDGPACVSLGITSDGPRLFGVRSGVCESDLPTLTREATGEGQWECAADARTDPRRFHGKAPEGYRLLRHAACVIVDAQPGLSVGGQPLGDWIAELPSYRAAPLGQGGHGSPGRQENAPLRVHLLHQRQSVVLRDYVAARLLGDASGQGPARQPRER
ncbi:hypothetical protein [Streptomyces sp. NPDC058623]|uniref:hypothetical protein n=1 Tax=Streptomyces sp. NPDC058623 TaxID=3346563 RepID=UPI003651F517